MLVHRFCILMQVNSEFSGLKKYCITHNEKICLSSSLSCQTVGSAQTRTGDVWKHAALSLDSQEEVLTKLCSANGRFSVKSFCRGWCMYACTCTQHGSDGAKYWVNQTLKHKNIPEKDKIIKWEPEYRHKKKKESEQRQCERFWFSAPVAAAVRSSCSGRVAFALPFHSSIPRAGRLSMIRKSRKDPPGPAATGKGGGGWDYRERKGHVVGFVNTPAQA